MCTGFRRELYLHTQNSGEQADLLVVKEIPIG